MNVSAKLVNRATEHHVEVETAGRRQALTISPKNPGRGSSVNGAELLCAALATCFCNDLHREAAKRKITVHEVDVEVNAVFGGEGDPARELTYKVRVQADAPEEAIQELIRATDEVVEIHKTVRGSCAVRLTDR
jgi:uncharacterized OsmC-like protein